MKINQSNLEILKLHSTEKTLAEWSEFFKKGKETISRWCRLLGVRYQIAPARIPTEEEKRKLSEKRKTYLKNNPDKHPWRSNDKFQSKPCENVKKFLTELGISYVSEFQPMVEGRFFSIDIAIPNKKIALEINGNQHYEKDGTLKPYYQERHDILEKYGWNILEIHYSTCFNLEKWKDFGKLITSSQEVEFFDYASYNPKISPKKLPKNNFCHQCKKRKRTDKPLCYSCSHQKETIYNATSKPYNECSVCGSFKTKKAKMCARCRNIENRKNFPPKEELKNWLNLLPMTKIGKHYGVSDNTAKKWCKFYKLLKDKASHE
jgi:transposase